MNERAWVNRTIDNWIESGRYGSITLHFHAGHVTQITKEETMRLKTNNKALDGQFSVTEVR